MLKKLVLESGDVIRHGEWGVLSITKTDYGVDVLYAGDSSPVKKTYSWYNIKFFELTNGAVITPEDRDLPREDTVPMYQLD
jgi:hypothetical protein